MDVAYIKDMHWYKLKQDGVTEGNQCWPQDQKNSVFMSIPKKGNVKQYSNYLTFALISQTSKVMLKILQASLQQYVNRELLMFKLDLEKAEEPEIKLPTFTGSWKKQESSRKTSISAFFFFLVFYFLNFKIFNSYMHSQTWTPLPPP